MKTTMRWLLFGCLVATAAGAQVVPGVVAEGGFEQSALRWTRRGELHVSYGYKPKSGTRHVQYGLRADGRTPVYGVTGSIEQYFTVPATVARPGITVWVWTTSEENDGKVHDTLTIEISNTTTVESRVLSNLDRGTDYVRYVIPVSKFSGQRVRLQLRGASDKAKSTLFRIDDVALENLPSTTVSFRGVVTEAGTGKPVAQAAVEWGAARTTSGANGSYAFTSVPCQTATLKVSASGYKTFELPGYAPNCYGAANVRNVALQPAPTRLSGYVTDRITLAPVPQAIVTMAAQSTVTDSTGFYGFDLPTCGTAATFSVSAPRYKTESFNYTPACRQDNKQNVTLGAQQTGFTLRTSPGATVTFGGMPPLTTSDGLYTFFGIACRSALLEIRLAGYETYSQSYQPVCDEMVWADVTLVPKTTRIRGVATVAGTLVPVPGVTIEYDGVRVTPNGDGQFQFWNVPCRAATLSVTATGYLPFKESYEPQCDVDNTKNVALWMIPTGTNICGVLRDKNTGRPIAGATLYFGSVQTTTDAEGKYCLSRVACGLGSMSIRKKEYPFTTLSITPLCGTTLVKDFELSPLQVSGRVQDAVTEDLLSGATVQWLGMKTVTKRDGRYSIAACGDGEVLITKPGYEPQQYHALTCQDGTGEYFRYVHMVPVKTRGNLLVRTQWGAVVTLDDKVATRTERGYALWDVPCGAPATLAVSAPGYVHARFLVNVSCGSMEREVRLVQTRISFSGVVLAGPDRVAGATVTWGGMTTTSNERGNWGFENVPCGMSSTLTVSKTGFTTYTANGIAATCPSYHGTTIMLTRN